MSDHAKAHGGGIKQKSAGNGFTKLLIPAGRDSSSLKVSSDDQQRNKIGGGPRNLSDTLGKQG